MAAGRHACIRLHCVGLTREARIRTVWETVDDGPVKKTLSTVPLLMTNKECYEE
jgi:hypothetical protein